MQALPEHSTTFVRPPIFNFFSEGEIYITKSAYSVISRKDACQSKSFLGFCLGFSLNPDRFRGIFVCGRLPNDMI